MDSDDWAEADDDHRWLLTVVLAEVEDHLFTRRRVGDDDLAQPGVAVPDVRLVASSVECGQDGRFGLVEQVLLELWDVEVEVEGETIAIPVGVECLAPAESEAQAGDRIESDPCDQLLEWGERQRLRSQAARVGCCCSQAARTVRGRVSECHSCWRRCASRYSSNSASSRASRSTT